MPDIRTLEPDDFKHLLIIEAESFSTGYSPYFLKMAPILYGNTSFIAIKGKSPLAYILCAQEQANPKRAWILSLAVRPKVRNQGLGEELLTRTLHVLSEMKIFDVKLSVSPAYETAVTLYQRHGFVACKKVEDYFGLGEHRLLMKKVLT